MRSVVLILIAACSLVSVKGYAQNISLTEKEAPIERVFGSIEKQSDYLFWYELPLLKTAHPVTVNATDLSITQALDLCLKDQPLMYTIVGKTIVITKKKENKTASGASSSALLNAVDSISSLDEVVLVGYGSFSKKNITGSISTISGKSIASQTVSSVDQAIAGQAAGVYVSHLTGTPGGGASIRVRGTGSITAGNEPLYVIDGFPVEGSYSRDLNPLAMINPNDIESIQILKDASSAAIYGSRGSNGVVLITTKKGISGKREVRFDTYYGVQQVLQKIDMLDAREYALLNIEARNNAWEDMGGNKNDPNSVRPDRLQIPAMFANPDALGKGTDWQGEVFRNAPIQNHHLSVSGGNENTQFLFSAALFDQQGIVIQTRFKRYSFRFNLDSRISGKIKTGISISPTYAKNNALPVDDQIFGGGILGSALAMPPTVPVFNPDGSYTTLLPASVNQFGAFDNPVAIANQFKRGTTAFRLLSNVYAEWEIINDLKLKTSFGTDYYDERYADYWPSTLARNGLLPPVDPEANASTTRNLVWLNENTLNYNKNVGNRHFINAMAGFTAQRGVIEDAYLKAINFPNDLVTTINAGRIIAGGTTRFDWSLLSYLARIHYNYDSRYLFTATMRRDGSSRFGANNRWATFPSVSLGWNISRENFMQSVGFISELKVRASYGYAGNNSIGNNSAQGLLSPDRYVFGSGLGAVVQGAELINLANPDLGWEVMKQADIGLDMGFFKNRIILMVDYYHKITSDLLLEVPAPGSIGFSSSLQNIGKVMNKGWELSLSSINAVHAFRWRTDLNVSFYQNKVLALGREGDPIITTSRGFSQQTHRTEIGQPIGSFYGYKAIGVYHDQADVDKSAKITGTAPSRPGDLKFRDNDGDGLITALDREILGNNIPDFGYGITNSFSYRNFSLSVLIDGVNGIEVLNGSRRNIDLTTHTYSRRDVLGRWQSPEDPGDGKTPRVNVNPTGGNVMFVSSLFIEDASFLRLRNINLKYTFPKQLFKSAPVKEASFFLTVQNALIISGYKGFNPEQSLNGVNPLTPGVEFNGYPLARVFTAGLTVAFQ